MCCLSLTQVYGKEQGLVTKTGREAVEVPHASLRTIPEHVFDVVLVSLRAALGSQWGKPDREVGQVFRRVRGTISDLEDIHLAADMDHSDKVGVRIQVWIDRQDLDLLLADDISYDILRGLRDREILIVSRSLEEDGLRYAFASGNTERGVVGVMMLIGPYAKDVSRLARISSGQPTRMSA
jgi:hypothetical protein